MEGDIRKLASQSNLSSGDKTELASLRAELESIQKVKADCESVLFATLVAY